MAWLPRLSPERASGGSIVFRGSGQLRYASCRCHSGERQWSVLTDNISSGRNWDNFQSFVDSIIAEVQSTRPGQCSKLWRPQALAKQMESEARQTSSWGWKGNWGRKIVVWSGPIGMTEFGSREWMWSNTVTALLCQEPDQVGKCLSDLGSSFTFFRSQKCPGPVGKPHQK